MANGKPHDHPLTDILIHRIEVYGPDADELIRRIAALCSRRELDEWWARELGWNCGRDKALQKAERRLEELLTRARNNGWELP